MPTDSELYLLGIETAVACWREFARAAVDASVERLPGVAIAAFPSGPERAVYNNAILERGLTAAERTDALGAMEAAYAAAGIARFAAWVHESDEAMRDRLVRRGYTLDTSTRATGMLLEDIRLPRPELTLSVDWLEHLRIVGVPPGFLGGADDADRGAGVRSGRLARPRPNTGIRTGY